MIMGLQPLSCWATSNYGLLSLIGTARVDNTDDGHDPVELGAPGRADILSS